MLVAHNTDLGLAFFNDRVKEIIDAGVIAEPFTYIPILAGHMELVGGNALVFGKITEGYDIIPINIETEVTYEDVSLTNPTIVIAVNFIQESSTLLQGNVPLYKDATTYHKGDIVNSGGNYFRAKGTTVGNTPFVRHRDGPSDPHWDYLSGVLSFRSIVGYAVIQFPTTIVTGYSYNISVQNDEEGIASTTASYTAQGGDTYLEVRQALIVDLESKGFEYYGGPPNGAIWLYKRAKIFIETPNPEAADVNKVFEFFKINAYILTYGNTKTYPSLKCGARHQFGIVYKDRSGRTCSVIKIDALSVYIPFYAEAVANGMGTLPKVRFKIYNAPPEWAESYEIVYFGNISMDWFLQLRLNNISAVPTSSGNRFTANIQETLDYTRNLNNRWKVSDYAWQAGDRLRLIGTQDASAGEVTPLYSGTAIGDGFDTSPYDYEVEAMGTQYNEEAIGGDWMVFQAVARPDPFEGETNILAEVYRPRKGLAQMTAYGTGMVFEIAINNDGYKYHKGDVDQVMNGSGECTSPAEVENTANDAWKYYRLNYKHDTTIIQPFWAESIFPSDWWSGQSLSNKLTSMGFPFLDDLSQRQQVLRKRIRHGGYLIMGTRTNNIAHFTFEDFMDFPEKNGDITALREVGFTLKIIQMYKETSVYINRIQTFNPDGTEQFTLTDKFLAEQRPMETDYGCQHPDSIMVNGRNLYYWDNSQGVFIRSSPNGQIVLDIKMKRWFKDLMRWIQAGGGKQALQTRTGANNDHDEVWVTFRVGTETKGLIFSEKNGRYISEINQITESYVHLGNFFAHLYRQQVWIMNIDEGQDWLTWNGVPTYAELEVVSNIDSIKNKIFNAVAVVADHLLQSVSKSVVIPEEASAVNEIMESNIPILERKEGVYYGKIMKDENSKGNFTSVFARKLNGRALRGRYCFVKFRTDEHDEKVRVDSIVVFSTPSERNI